MDCWFCDLDALREEAEILLEYDVCLLANNRGDDVLPAAP
jgi:hypothetical protein